tara:strand:+ start:34722 stop:36197 length:1476 start_codon:yes stop_codon:yes gene_type:complete
MPENQESLQKKFIHLLLKGKDMVGKWIDSPLEVKHFDKKYRVMLNCIEDCYSRDTLLTLNAFMASITGMVSNAVMSEQEVTFNSCKISIAKPDDFYFLQNSIVDNYVLNNSVVSIQRFQKESQKGSNVVAAKKLITDLEGIIDLSKEETATFENVATYGEVFIQRLQDLKDGKIKEDPRIECGIREIDETMVTGFAPGTLTLFCADVGGFKSTMMINLALNIWRKNHNVLFVPLEMPRDQIYAKVSARECRIDSEKIIKGALTDEEHQKIKDFNKEMLDSKHKLYMLKASDRIPVKFIKRQIKMHFELFKPKVVVIDYIINLIPDQPRRDGRNDLEIGDMLKSLRVMGDAMGFAVVSGAQLGREALRRIRKSGTNSDKQILHSEDIRSSHEFAADADNIYAQVLNPADHDALDIYVVKARNGKKIFPDGHMKASLNINPALSLITSGIGLPDEDEDFASKEFEDYEEAEDAIDSLDLDTGSVLDDEEIEEW